MSEDIKAKLAEALARREQREATAALDIQARQLNALEVEERYSETLGPRGRDWDLVSTIEGVVVLKVGPAVLFKRLRDGKASLDDLQAFVAGCLISPDAATFASWVERRAGILVRCSDALVQLYLGAEDAERGKS